MEFIAEAIKAIVSFCGVILTLSFFRLSMWIIKTTPWHKIPEQALESVAPGFKFVHFFIAFSMIVQALDSIQETYEKYQIDKEDKK